MIHLSLFVHMLIGNYYTWIVELQLNYYYIIILFRRGNCKLVTVGQDCEVGLRRRTYNVLSGSVLSVWSRIENVLLARTGSHHKMQVVRLKTGEGIKIVGKLHYFYFIIT